MMICKICNKKFTKRFPWQITCGGSCSKKHKSRKNDKRKAKKEQLIPKQCKCGKIFFRSFKNQRSCSEDCRKYRREKYLKEYFKKRDRKDQRNYQREWYYRAKKRYCPICQKLLPFRKHYCPGICLEKASETSRKLNYQRTKEKRYQWKINWKNKNPHKELAIRKRAEEKRKLIMRIGRQILTEAGGEL